MFATIDYILGTILYWVLPTLIVAVLSVLVSKGIMQMLTQAQEGKTYGAWFRLPLPQIYFAAVFGSIFGIIVVSSTMIWIDCGPCEPAAKASCCDQRPWIASLVPALTWRAVWLTFLAFGWPLTWAYFVWRDTVLRIRSIEEPKQEDILRLNSPHKANGGKTIVILCDGTGNRADELGSTGLSALTNVAKFHRALKDRVESEWTQVKWYDPGVGTFSSRRAGILRHLAAFTSWIGSALPGEIASVLSRLWNIVELGFGVGILENVSQGYAEIVRQYEPGDRIAILGFSRGAYTARVIAGVIARAGLLKAEYVRFAPDVVQLYRYRRLVGDPVKIDRELRYSRYEVPVHFLGLWDTVASLGVPMWGWWFRIGRLWRNESIDTSPADICLSVRHAISMDERRGQFFPTLFDEPEPEERSCVKEQEKREGFPQKIEQVWFRGSHADVGGGYGESDLSDEGLKWMVDRAAQAGLQFDDARIAAIKATYLGSTHDEIERSPGWKYFGSWPRWHPCPREHENHSQGFGSLDPSVYRRADHARKHRVSRARALSNESKTVNAEDLPLSGDELQFLEIGERARVRVCASRTWNRSGLVFEQGGFYQVALAGGSWRDKECASTSAAGQKAERRGDLRAWLGWGRRLSKGHWMTLVGTVAHPRDWPLAEKPGRELIRYLLWEDPEELVDQLIPLPLESSDRDAILIEVLAMSGMFHCFANDIWAFYDNNSGAIELDITRIDPLSVSSDTPRVLIPLPPRINRAAAAPAG